MNITTFKRKYLSVDQKEKANELSREYRKRVKRYEDTSFYNTEISLLLAEPAKQFAADLFGDDLPTESYVKFDEDYKGNEIEIILCKWDEGWVPSVVTLDWDAKASTIDPACAVQSPVDAFAWGFTDAMTHHILWRGI
jgi:hypothetical protein